MDFARQFTSPSPANGLTLTELANIIGRGGTEDWRELYARALHSQRLRQKIRACLPLVDPEIGDSRKLWQLILDTMPPIY
jgi:hypothetical protein